MNGVEPNPTSFQSASKPALRDHMEWMLLIVHLSARVVQLPRTWLENSLPLVAVVWMVGWLKVIGEQGWTLDGLLLRGSFRKIEIESTIN